MLLPFAAAAAMAAAPAAAARVAFASAAAAPAAAALVDAAPADTAPSDAAITANCSRGKLIPRLVAPPRCCFQREGISLQEYGDHAFLA
jgi:hypothetical protein